MSKFVRDHKAKLVVAATVLAMVSVVAGEKVFEAYKCHAKFDGFSPEWGIIIGCTVEHNGKRLPVDRFWVDGGRR